MIVEKFDDFEVIFLLNLIPALRVKDTTIFDLLDQNFYYGEFIFFSRLAAHLGRIAEISAEDAQEVGVLSELIYLSSKIHFFLVEKAETEEQLRAELQMPVLIGDLLYGRFVVSLTETEKKDYLPIYVDYLKQFNRHRIDMLLEQMPMKDEEQYVKLLTKKTAEVIAALADRTSIHRENLEIAAENYLEEQWALLYGEQITSLTVLEEKMQAEMI